MNRVRARLFKPWLCTDWSGDDMAGLSETKQLPDRYIAR